MTTAARNSDLAQISKFDGSNFQLWKFSVSILLKAEKLMPVVDGTEAEPVDQSTPGWKTWEEKNCRAQVILLTTISQDQIQNLVNCENAATMWRKLIVVHEQKTELSKEIIWQKFYEYRMNDSNTIATHISKIESLVKQLRDVNETISNSAITSKVINSLPAKYNAFRTAWDSVDANRQTLDNLTARLLKEETRMSQSEDEVSRLALQVQSLQTKLDEKSNQKRKAHPVNDLKRKTTCHYCKMKGHWARECRKRLAKAEKSGFNSNKSENAYICDISSLYSSSSEQDQFEWICDSGASAHMTNQSSWFIDIKPLKEPLLVKVANDKLISAVGSGTICIQAQVGGQWHDRKIENVLYIPELKRSLFSVGAMINKGYTHHAFKDYCEFRDNRGNLSCKGTRKNNLWYMKFKIKHMVECNIAKKQNLKLWH